MFTTAADALFEHVAPSIRPGAPIFPPLRRLREVSWRVAVEVGWALVNAGAAPQRSRDEIEEPVQAEMWEPVYRAYRPGP